MNELRKELKLMKDVGLIRPWWDRALKAGEKWKQRILRELNEADVIVCQLSRDFLASDFCVLTELDTAIRRKKAGKVELIAYVLRHCSWQQVTRLAQFQVLPKDAKPLRKWADRDEYWKEIAEGIRSVLGEFQRVRSVSASGGVRGKRTRSRAPHPSRSRANR